MKLIHRYILKELTGPAILGLIIFTFILLLRQLFDIIDLIINQGVSSALVTQLLLCAIPQILIVTIPMALLVAALLAFGRLATDNEVVAMRTMGLHLFWIVTPAVIVGVVISLALAALNFNVMPHLATQLTDLKYRLIFQSIASLEPGQVYEDFSIGSQEVSFMFDSRGDEPGEMRGVVFLVRQVANITDAEEMILLTAERGFLTPNLDQRAVEIRMNNGEIQMRGRLAQQDRLRTIRFDEVSQLIRPPLRRVKNGEYRAPPSEMTISSLGDAIEGATNERTRNELRVERHRRMVFPFSSLAFILIGIPFGIVTRSAGKGIGLGIAFLLILSYYGLMEWGKAVTLSGSSLAGLAMWSPNIALGTLGLIMLWWVSKK